MAIIQQTFHFTVDDLDAFPDDGLRREVIDGELYVTHAPDMRHQFALDRLNGAFDAWGATGARRGLAMSGPAVIQALGGRQELDAEDTQAVTALMGGAARVRLQATDRLCADNPADFRQAVLDWMAQRDEESQLDLRRQHNQLGTRLLVGNEQIVSDRNRAQARHGVIGTQRQAVLGPRHRSTELVSPSGSSMNSIGVPSGSVRKNMRTPPISTGS